MEDSETPHQNPTVSFSSTVDTSRPFCSVKEAVAVFGERLLVGEVYSSPKPCAHDVPMQETSMWKCLPSPMISVKEDTEYEVIDTLKKLEAELEETKKELRLLKEREEDTEVALASLNAEVHKNMSKLAEAEAAAAAKLVATRRITVGSGSCESSNGESGRIEEEMKRSSEWMRMRMRMEESAESPTLAKILSIGEKRGYFGRKKIKKKPIIPLVGELFSRKKETHTDPPHLYSISSHLFN